MSGLGILAECPKNLVEPLTHRVIDGLCSRTQPRVVDFEKMVSPSQWRQLTTALQDALKKVARTDDGNVKDTFESSGLPSNLVEIVTGAVIARVDELREALLSNTETIATSTIQDFDWNIAVAVASDKMATLNEPLMQLSLNVAHSSGNDDDIHMELSLSELQTLISKLESANKVVRDLVV
eukprot:m.90561 g.90561  ORF g.90561 m.90561 type:complete len:181 (-) comp16467_c0_seq1:181-723(-)